MSQPVTVAGQVFHPVAVLAQVVLNEVEMHAREELIELRGKRRFHLIKRVVERLNLRAEEVPQAVDSGEKVLCLCVREVEGRNPFRDSLIAVGRCLDALAGYSE